MDIDAIKGCTVTEALDAATAAESRLAELFGFEGLWRQLPYDDCTGVWWAMDGDNVWWGLTDESGPDEDGRNYTHAEVYKAIVKRTASGEHVMIGVDTHCDYNVYLCIFDAARRLTDPEAMRNLAGDDDWRPDPFTLVPGPPKVNHE